MTKTTNVRDPSGIAASPPGASATNSSASISPEAAAVLVAITVPLVVIAIVIVCFFQIQKHWKLRQAQSTAAAIINAGREPVTQSEDVQLYMQNKAELSVEQTGHSMQHDEEIFELMGCNLCQEMPGAEVRQPMLSLGERHELRGEDHARELDASLHQQDPRRYSFDKPRFTAFNESTLTLRQFV